jgi:hypothetical protein
MLHFVQKSRTYSGIMFPYSHSLSRATSVQRLSCSRRKIYTACPSDVTWATVRSLQHRQRSLRVCCKNWWKWTSAYINELQKGNWFVLLFVIRATGRQDRMMTHKWKHPGPSSLLTAAIVICGVSDINKANDAFSVYNLLNVRSQNVLMHEAMSLGSCNPGNMVTIWVIHKFTYCTVHGFTWPAAC